MAMCDTCVYFVYDDDLGEDVCMVDMDEDELLRFYDSSDRQCPYYRLDDEYGVVKHQI